MTDVMSEAFGRELNARTTFEKEAVWVPLMAVHAQSGGETTLKGKTFTDCLIQGPALVAIVGETTFDGCNMGRVTDVRSLTFTPQGSLLVGAIGLEDCRFVRCQFEQVGFTGAPAFLQQLVEQLQSAREAQA